MSRTRRRRRVLFAVAAGAMCAVAAVPFASGGPGPSPSPIPEGCQLRAPQPDAPLKLNVVAVRKLAKTIVMEKEVFDCFNAQGALTQVKDVETFIEVVERARQTAKSKPGMAIVAKSAAAATCVKNLTSGRVSCRFDRLPLGTSQTPLAGCSLKSGTYPFEPVAQPKHPVQMETVSLPGGIVRTVKVEKEVFDCGGAIGDVYVFTELLERAVANSFRPPVASFHGVVCLKNAATARITGCRVFAPTNAS
jgi:hypothetical protein